MAGHVLGLEGEFSDTIAQSEHCLSRVDPRVKVVVAGAALVVAVSTRGLALPLVLLGGATGLCLAMKVRPRLLAARLVAPFSVAAAVMAGQLFLWRGHTLFALHLGPWTLTATDTGLREGLLIGGRVLGSVSVVLALSFSTPFQHLLAVARWLRAPSAMVEVASLIYRYLFLLRDEVVTMASAQRARLGYADTRRSLRSAAAVGGMAFLRAYDRAAAVHRAMVCRGYRGELHGARLPPVGWREALQVLSSLALLAAAAYVDYRLRAG